MIVKPDDADPGLANSRPISIDGDHWSICKPIDRSYDTYVFVRKFIESAFEPPKAATEEGLTVLNAKVDILVAALGAREAASAEKAGVSRQVIITLAQRIKADVDNFDQALRELDRAVGVAVEVAQDGQRRGNTGAFIDLVLARIAQKSSAGQFNEAASEADAAFEQWEHEEAKRHISALQGGLRLLDAGLKQDILPRPAAPEKAAKC